MPNRAVMTFYGQKQEDRIAYQFLKRLPESQLKKTFLDVGAYDGKHLSNTLLFEELGWRGICIEADEHAFRALRENRKCICVNSACAEKEGTVDFYTEPNRPIGTTNAEAAEKLKAGGHFQSTEKKRIPATTVNKILETHGMVEIDFVSIDVAGAEVQVLRGFDLMRTKPKLVCIETNMKQVKSGKWPRKHVDSIHRIMTGYGYYLLKVHGANSFYAWDRLSWLDRLLMGLGR
jgi:FkbM family methyltransferase